MASVIKGIQVILINKIESGVDPFGAPIYEDKEIIVDNVLVTPTSTDEIVNQLELSGKRAVYTLAIPKDDTNNWDNSEVKFFGKTWRTIGAPKQGIAHLIPLDWNKKVEVELIE